ncbi:hypothetical protein [Glycomyces sp. MUSA5-2]|uniref:hypothetical protein n=1 Tax=Glycomyces sp. MUSA5-2 TaxID=2053002 RepID=UPI00300A23CE
MASRDEIQAMILQVKEGIEQANVAAAAAMEACRQSADEEGGKGHEGIASLYRTGSEAMEKVSAALQGASTEADEAQNWVAQTQG